jgi:hypothetical protein
VDGWLDVGWIDGWMDGNVSSHKRLLDEVITFQYFIIVRNKKK